MVNRSGSVVKLAKGKPRMDNVRDEIKLLIFSPQQKFNVRFAPKQGIEDLTVHDFKLLLGVDIQITLSKADRMIYGESAMTHAMTFTAVSCDVSAPNDFQ